MPWLYDILVHSKDYVRTNNLEQHSSAVTGNSAILMSTVKAWCTGNKHEDNDMEKRTVKQILQRIAKNAERGAGMASGRGLFEDPAPKKLIRQEKAKN